MTAAIQSTLRNRAAHAEFAETWPRAIGTSA